MIPGFRRHAARVVPSVAVALLVAGCGPKVPVGYAPGGPDLRISQGESAQGSSIRWVAPREPGNTQAWRVGVGAPVLLRPAPAEPAAVDSLAVVTWNTHAGGGAIGRLVEDLRSGAFTDGVPVPHFVLLVQEAYREGPEVPAHVRADHHTSTVRATPPEGERVDIEEVARKLGLALFYTPSVRNGDATDARDAEDRGNAILSTLPLSAPTALELPHENQRRVVVTANVAGHTAAGEAWHLDLLSVHLDTRSRLARLLGSFERGRLRQASFLTAALPENGAAVLGGDLNTWFRGENEPSVRHLRRHFPVAAGPPEGSTFRLGPIGRRMDYLFFRIPGGWVARQERIDRRYGSDHHPLLGWVRFGAPGPEGGGAPPAPVRTRDRREIPPSPTAPAISRSS